METFFKQDRAKYMGVWTLLLTLGIPCGPFIFGFVTYRAGYVWIYWVLAIVSFPISKGCIQQPFVNATPDQRRPVYLVPLFRTRNTLCRQQ